MKRILILLTFMPLLMSAGVPDSVFVKVVTRGNDTKNLYLDWSADGLTWNEALGAITQSDYGAWGSGKNLFNPTISIDDNGLATITFDVKADGSTYGITYTTDFVNYKPQDYYDRQARPLEDGRGQVVKVPYDIIRKLIDRQRAMAYKNQREGELAKDNLTRFAGLEAVKADVVIDATAPKAISDMLMGIFFEDINYCADGGLNADLVENGDFEYLAGEGKGKDWGQLYAWKTTGDLSVATDERGVSDNNAHAVRISGSGALLNLGWDGMNVKKGAKLCLSLYIKGKAKVSIVDGDKVLATTTVSGGKEWRQAKATLVPTADATSAALSIEPVGEVSIDIVSLMPSDTYKGHGLRRDLAETLAALKPRFMRFPGGCVAHGNGLGNIYNWKETIGRYEDRKPARNLWGYHQSRRIGYYEFFQMCEDMGMEPLPVVAAGVPCQNSSIGGAGQQGGIPMEDMPQYIQDILDLIEWANGDASTTWGRKRIEQGHKKPFGLKMIGIGNEDLISDVFAERYLMICKAVKAKYPDIEICGTAGPFYYGSDYDRGWQLATDNADVIDMVDEHYYVSPGWYIYNQDFYDQYSRTAPKVYLGEWAAHGPGRKSTIETALSEAMHYCSLERNGDVVKMSSYAPLLAKDGHTQWNPDMIYFNNQEVKPTVGYYAQLMCGQSQGDTYLPATIKTAEKKEGVRERLAVSAVKDSKTGKTYLKLVNILPVDVEAHLTLKGLIAEAKTCKTTTLSGPYDSTTARPAQGTITLKPECDVTLPAYSFVLVEL